MDWGEVENAFRRVCDGYVAEEGGEPLWVRLTTEGRIVGRHNDGERDRRLRVLLTVVEHPALNAGEVYAFFGMGGGRINTYRCAAGDAVLALRHHGAFNL
jgi:hypothetical protein